MIARYYALYVERAAADRGLLAFFKWWIVGFALQIALLIPALPLLVVGSVLRQDAGGTVAVYGFAAAFIAARVCEFVVPCSRVAKLKGLGAPWAWGAGGLIIGQWSLALAASLPPRSPAGAAA